MTLFEAVGPPSLKLATFSADGTVVTAEHPVLTPPIAPGVVFTSSGHGIWKTTGPHTIIVTFVGLGSMGQGILFGSATARSSIRIARDGRIFSGNIVSGLLPTRTGTRWRPT
jgi:hypothetical protein